MKKILIFISAGMIIFLTQADISVAAQGQAKQGRYENRADSLRKENLSPSHDSVQRSRTDKMPVKTQTVDSNSQMPKVVPDNKDQHMPVKELSDTLNRK